MVMANKIAGDTMAEDWEVERHPCLRVGCAIDPAHNEGEQGEMIEREGGGEGADVAPWP